MHQPCGTPNCRRTPLIPHRSSLIFKMLAPGSDASKCFVPSIILLAWWVHKMGSSRGRGSNSCISVIAALSVKVNMVLFWNAGGPAFKYGHAQGPRK